MKPAQARGVGEDVDLDDLPARDREAELVPRMTARRSSGRRSSLAERGFPADLWSYAGVNRFLVRFLGYRGEVRLQTPSIQGGESA